MESTWDAQLGEFEDPTQLVAAGYDEVGEAYNELALQSNGTRERFTNLVLERLADGSAVLDLGCGAGQPTTARPIVHPIEVALHGSRQPRAGEQHEGQPSPARRGPRFRLMIAPKQLPDWTLTSRIKVLEEVPT